MTDPVDRASAAMRAKLKGPSAEFTGKVMAEVRRLPQPQRAPRGIELPRWSIPLAAAAAVVIWFAGAHFSAKPAPMVATRSADTVYVRFEISAPTARQVHLAGDFSGWQPSVQLVKDPGGKWVATLPIAIGVHRYQFVVDNSWIPDPAVGGVDDGFGGRNSVMVVGPKGVVRS